MNDKIKKFVNKDLLLYSILVLTVLAISFFVWLKFEYISSWNYFKMNESHIDNDIVLVAIDERTLNSDNFKRYQDLNRADYAWLLRNISYGHPKAIWVDIFFVNESQTEVEDRELKNVLTQFPNIIIWSEVDNRKVVMPFVSDYQWVWYVNTISYNHLDILNLWFWKYKNKIPLYFNWTDVDIPLFLKVYMAVNNIESVNVSEHKITYQINWKTKSIPLEKGDFNVNFFWGYDTYKRKFKVVSFYDVVAWNVDSQIFNDKIVFVGATAKDIHDEFYTPYDITDMMPWVLLHANAYNTLSSWKFIRYEWFFVFIFINLLLFISFVLLIVRTQDIFKGIIYSWWLFIIYIFISIVSFKLFWYFLEIFPSLIWYILINSILFIKKYLEEQESKNKIKSIFSKYVSKEVVDQIVHVWVDNLGLWWQKKNITIFFSDLVWFTSLSENLDPQELWTILNLYFEEMTHIILDNKWTIDKFIGDSVMAFWNAPLDIQWHEQLACETALQQRIALDKVREEVRKTWVDTVIDMRIGINTWQVLVWNFWCSTRYEYTVLWDDVNLASRLESINKQYWTKIIISEDTYKNIDSSKFFIRELDIITVKWKIKPVKIYELMAFYDSSNQKLIELIKKFEYALCLYRESKFIEAKEKFDLLDDDVSKLFSKRCEEFAASNQQDWDWIYKFKIK